MSAIIVVLLFPIIIAVGALLFLINKLYPGGIMKAFSSDADTKLTIAGSSLYPEKGNYYKLREKEDDPGNFMFIFSPPGSEMTGDEYERSLAAAAAILETGEDTPAPEFRTRQEHRFDDDMYDEGMEEGGDENNLEE